MQFHRRTQDIKGRSMWHRQTHVAMSRLRVDKKLPETRSHRQRELKTDKLQASVLRVSRERHRRWLRTGSDPMDNRCMRVRVWEARVTTMEVGSCLTSMQLLVMATVVSQWARRHTSHPLANQSTTLRKAVAPRSPDA